MLCYVCKKFFNFIDMDFLFWEEGMLCFYCFYGKFEVEKIRVGICQEQFLYWGVIGGLDRVWLKFIFS